MTEVTHATGVMSLLSESEVLFRRLNKRSAAAIQRLAGSLPGGDTRSTTWFEPFPLVIESARGCQMTDVDGHLLTDFLGNYTSLVHGHAHPAVVRALASALERGTAFAAPLAEQGDLAERIVERVPSVDLVRFTNSGTEANLLAGRIARAVTGRTRLAVARHSYHGSYEPLDWNQASATGTHVFPANDVERTLQALGDGRDLAAVFVEPVLGSGGVIPLAAEYLGFLREFTATCDALLVFDEVMSLRVSLGGQQQTIGVEPDLTTFGKLIGGGLPIGAVGGKRAVLEFTAPTRPDAIPHGGTYNGNRLAMVAGSAALDLLDAAAIARINALGETLAAGIRALAAEHSVPVSVTGIGSLMNLHALPAVRSPEDAATAASQPLRRLLHLKFLEHGVFTAARGELCVSTAMSEVTIADALGAIGRAFREVASAFEE